MGALLMQLAGEHKLSLGDKVSQYIEGVPNGDTMTLRQVADLTSGVASYTADPAFMQALFSDPEQRWRPRQLLEVGLRASPLFSPGTAFQYSDSNYVLLGLVIRQVEGRPLRAVLRKRIFDPLRLAQTSWPGGSTALPKPFSRGYTLQGQASDEPADATNWNPSSEWAAGEMISTVRDLLVYGRAFGTGKGLLRPAQQRERLRSFDPKSRRRARRSRTASGWSTTGAGSDTRVRCPATPPPSTTTRRSKRRSSWKRTATSSAALAQTSQP
jgi:D-alanyl-D-alanine carboxypeptidase